MQQNAKDISLDGGFIRLFGDNTLQVLSARLKLNFCVPNKNRRTGQTYHAIAATKKHRFWRCLNWNVATTYPPGRSPCKYFRRAKA